MNRYSANSINYNKHKIYKLSREQASQKKIRSMSETKTVAPDLSHPPIISNTPNILKHEQEIRKTRKLILNWIILCISLAVLRTYLVLGVKVSEFLFLR